MVVKVLDVVTIDGPAGAGKSTVARAVARNLGYTFMDTGAMYRAIALGAVRGGISMSDTSRLSNYLDQVDLTITTGSDLMQLELNGEDVTRAIREPEVGRFASDYSTLPEVRKYCSTMQRRLGEAGGIVCEGRDMGTVVFPDARWKFFLTASAEERARRRGLELSHQGKPADIKEIQRSIEERDTQDSQRKLAPLKPADDAKIVDTTGLNFDQVVKTVLDLVKSGKTF